MPKIDPNIWCILVIYIFQMYPHEDAFDVRHQIANLVETYLANLQGGVFLNALQIYLRDHFRTCSSGLNCMKCVSLLVRDFKHRERKLPSLLDPLYIPIRRLISNQEARAASTPARQQKACIDATQLNCKYASSQRCNEIKREQASKEQKRTRQAARVAKSASREAARAKFKESKDGTRFWKLKILSPEDRDIVQAKGRQYHKYLMRVSKRQRDMQRSSARYNKIVGTPLDDFTCWVPEEQGDDEYPVYFERVDLRTGQVIYDI